MGQEPGNGLSWVVFVWQLEERGLDRHLSLPVSHIGLDWSETGLHMVGLYV